MVHEALIILMDNRLTGETPISFIRRELAQQRSRKKRLATPSIGRQKLSGKSERNMSSRALAGAPGASS